MSAQDEAMANMNQALDAAGLTRARIAARAELEGAALTELVRWRTVDRVHSIDTTPGYRNLERLRDVVDRLTGDGIEIPTEARGPSPMTTPCPDHGHYDPNSGVIAVGAAWCATCGGPPAESPGSRLVYGLVFGGAS